MFTNKQHNHRQEKEAGFALLITIIVLSVVLAVGLSLLDISLKQINLAITARDSELAFAAANSGIECAQFSRFNLVESLDFDKAQFAYRCFNQPIRIINNSSNPTNSTFQHRNARTDQYNTTYDVSTTSGPMCVDISVVIIRNRNNPISFPYDFINQGVASRDCPAGSVCTNIFSRGFNRACADIGDGNTVQREMTAEF